MNLDSFYSFWGGWFAQPDELKQERRRRRDPVTGKGSGNWYPAGSEAPGYGAKDTHKEYVHLWWKDVQPGEWAEASRAVWQEAWDRANWWMLERGLTSVMEALNREDQVLRVLHYLPHPTGEVGAAHKDYDLLTVNLPGTAPGLERYQPGKCKKNCPSCWIPEEEGIHVGEMLEIYTAHHERAPGSGMGGGLRGYAPIPADLHRVRTAPNTERLKAVFFVLPPMDFVLRPGCSLCDGSGTSSYLGMAGFEYLPCGCEGQQRAFTAHDYLLGPNGVLVKAGAK